MRAGAYSWGFGVVAFALWSCAEEPPGTNYDLMGYVSQSIGGNAIGGARIRFTSDTGTVAQTTTDGSGRYELTITSDVEFGQVRAEAEGFVALEKTVYFDVPARRVDLELQRAP